MAAPDRPRHRLSRHIRAHRNFFVVGVVFAATILLEVGAVNGYFGLVANLWNRPSGPEPPNLNPNHERILAIDSAITYFGSTQGYFPAVNHTDFCQPVCPALILNSRPNPPEIELRFYFNVTNTANATERISEPSLETSGPDPTLFSLWTFCCYSTQSVSYTEGLSAWLEFTPGFTFGLEGYVFTTQPIPANAAGGYTLFFNVTSG
ncbi:MAG: hypothetical protein ACLQD8_04940 [Thermoplasmata archaeon]